MNNNAWMALGSSAGKYFGDLEKEKRQRKLAAATQRYSPWTGLKAEPIQEADFMADAAQGIGSYMGMEQADEQLRMDKERKDQELKNFNAWLEMERNRK